MLTATWVAFDRPISRGTLIFFGVIIEIFGHLYISDKEIGEHRIVKESWSTKRRNLL